MSEDLNTLISSLNVSDQLHTSCKSLSSKIINLDSKLKSISQSIQSISGPVRELETQRCNARLALTHVDNIIEFHTKYRELLSAVKFDNLPSAAMLCGQISEIPIHFHFSEIQDFQKVKLEVCEKVKKTFGEALSENNKAVIEQYAGLFHHLQLGREGIESYIRYIVENLRTQFDSIIGSLQSGGNYEECLVKIYRSTVKQYDTQYENITKEFGISGTLDLLQHLQKTVDDYSVKTISQYLQLVNQKFKSQSLCEEMTKIIKHSESFELYMQKLGKKLIDSGAVPSSADKSSQTGLTKLSSLKAKIMELADLYISIESEIMADSVKSLFDKFHIGPVAESLFKEKSALTSGTLFEKVDDSFFTIQNACTRVMSTFNLNSVCAFLNNISPLISENILGTLTEKLPHLKPAWSSQASVQNSMYIILLNLLSTTRKCIVKIVNNLEQQFNKIFGDSNSDLIMFQNCVGSLSDSQIRCKDIIDKMTANLGRNLNLPLLLAGFKVFSFEVSLEQHSEYEVNDPFALMFVKDFKNIAKQWACQLSTENFETLVEVCAVEIAGFVEKEVRNKKFNELGALQFQKDLREIITQFQNMVNKPIRGKFVRVRQISELLLAIDDGEVRALAADSEWKLTERETRAFRTLRV